MSVRSRKDSMGRGDDGGFAGVTGSCAGSLCQKWLGVCRQCMFVHVPKCSGRTGG